MTDEAEYTRQFNVVIEHVPWRGDSPAPPGGAITQFTQAIYVEGHLMTFREWMDHRPDEEIECGADLEMRGFMQLRLRHLDTGPFDALNVTEAEWMDEGDTKGQRENFAIPVASLVTRTAVFHGSRGGSF